MTRPSKEEQEGWVALFVAALVGCAARETLKPPAHEIAREAGEIADAALLELRARGVKP